MGRQFLPQERYFLVMGHHRGQKYKSLMVCFGVAFPNARKPSYSGLIKMVKKFEQENTLKNVNLKRSGRRRSVRILGVIQQVQAVLERERDLPPGFPRSSARRNNLMLSKTSFSRIVRLDLKLHAYKLGRHCRLSERARRMRLEMCGFLVRQLPSFYEKLIVTDEATFCLNGHVFNRKTNVCYSRTRNGKPRHFFTESVQSPQKLMVFLVAVGDGNLFGPYFYSQRERINAAKYQEKLREEVFPDMIQTYGYAHFRTLWWQQDGAPPHTAKTSIRFLDEVFSNRMLALKSVHGQIWAPSSPDLSPLDFSIWAIIKQRVYAYPMPQSLQELSDKISQVTHSLNPVMIEHIVNDMPRRAHKCIMSEGGHFEGLQF